MRVGAVFVGVGLLAAGCGPADDPTSASTGVPATVTTDPGARTEEFSVGEVVRASVVREAVVVTDSELAAVVAADRAFGLDLFRVVAGDNNVMVSPYSVATALSMLHPGARGVTADEIADVLHLDVDDSVLHAVRNHLDTALATVPVNDGDTREPFTLRPVNSAWGQGGYPFLDTYLETLAENYGAGLRLLDYIGDPEGSREIINAWVEEATEARIQDLIPAGAIDSLTRLALVNAIWFKANWFHQFDTAATTVGSFSLLDGTTVQVPLMFGDVRTGYVSTDLFEAVRLGYAGDAAMVLLLPKQGSPADLAAALTPDDLDIAWSDYQVAVTLPRFEFEADIDLIPALRQLGIRTAFVQPAVDDGADFTGITAARELYVSGAFHKTFISLDEQGTEAAAATAIIISLESESAPAPPATFTANRPFLFWIEHTPTSEMLFLGQVTHPA